MKGTIPSLDGIRGASFLIVFAAHAGLERYIPGGFGVTVFFFLSGYLITTLMRSEFERTGTVSLKHFYLRRALRILPPFYFVLLAADLYSGTFTAGALAQALHVANYRTIFYGFKDIAPGTGVYWSLAVEEHFYLLFPLLFLAIQRFRAREQAQILYGLCALVLLWRCYLIAHGAPMERTYMGSDTRMDSILFGCALGVRGTSSGSERLWKVLLPVALAAIAATFVIRDDAFRETWRYSIQGVALTVIFVSAVRFPIWAAFAWLNTRPMMALGAISYSLYLMHQVVIYALGGAGYQGLPRAMLALALCIGFATALYIGIERPAARLRKHLTTGLSAVHASRSQAAPVFVQPEPDR